MQEDTSYSEADKAVDESLKLGYDWFKHITTLSTGSILISIALLEKLFQNPVAKWLVAVAFRSFVVAIMGSLVQMFMIADYVGPSGYTKGGRTLLLVFVLAIGGFVCGLLCLVVFALKNL